LGSGGVGKTTTAAALGVAAALVGKRALCLTIDPARRLAQSLGVSENKVDVQRVAAAKFREVGLKPKGSLAVLVLDAKRTFDDLIRKYSSSTLVCERILKNRFYRYVSTSLGGTREYMAVEKVFEIKDDPAWDVIILDTPPTTNALDFLDAPERLIAAIDNVLIRWVVAAFKSGPGLNVIARGAAAALRGLGRITGQAFLETTAEFLIATDELFSGFRERAEEVRRALRGKDVACVLVTSPDPMCVRETVFLSERLKQLKMPRTAVVVNRVHTLAPAPIRAEEAQAQLRKARIDLGPTGTARVMRAAQDEARRAALDGAHLAVLSAHLGQKGVIRIDVPAFAGDVHDMEALARVAGAML
jgi:anion-transporting  ArsA/GET3 family ATPase